MTYLFHHTSIHIILLTLVPCVCLSSSHCSFLFFFFFSSRRRHTRSVSAFLLNRSSDLHSFSSRTSEAALWPSTYISPLSNSTPCIRKDRISSKSLMRLSICLWKPSIGD